MQAFILLDLTDLLIVDKKKSSFFYISLKQRNARDELRYLDIIRQVENVKLNHD